MGELERNGRGVTYRIGLALAFGAVVLRLGSTTAFSVYSERSQRNGGMTLQG